MSRRKRDGLVYSTDQGRMCPGCLRPVAQCVCRDQSRLGSVAGGGNAAGIVRISRQTKGRKGAGVTLVNGLPLPVSELADLAKSLKRHCGVGGAVKEGVIELQGDQREKTLIFLEKAGYKVKLSGG